VFDVNSTLTSRVNYFQRNDIAMAVAKYDQFDFLIDIVPRDELKPQKRQVKCDKGFLHSIIRSNNTLKSWSSEKFVKLQQSTGQ
jgi:hypothetical protein